MPLKENEPDDEEEEVKESLNIFVRPATSDITLFFKLHPKQPSSFSKLPFSEKVFRKEKGQDRCWLSYNELNYKLYCSVCLAFAKTNESNSFIEGMSDWKHVQCTSENQET